MRPTERNQLFFNASHQPRRSTRALIADWLPLHDHTMSPQITQPLCLSTDAINLIMLGDRSHALPPN